jgi:hypothetical protein
MSQRDALRKAGVDIYIGASTVDRKAVEKRILGDDAAKAISARDALARATLANVSAQAEALVARMDLHAAEMKLRTATTQREIDKIKASDAREQAKIDAVDADPQTRARLRAQGEFEALRARDTADTTKADSPRDVAKRLVMVKS